MDITTEIDKRAGLRKHKVKGTVTLEALVDALQQIYSAPDFDPDMNSLWDFTEAEFSSVSSSDIEEFSEFVASHWGKAGKSRAALVVSREFEMGLTKMYEVFIESRTASEVEVFLDLDEALEWIRS